MFLYSIAMLAAGVASAEEPGDYDIAAAIFLVEGQSRHFIWGMRFHSIKSGEPGVDYSMDFVNLYLGLRI